MTDKVALIRKIQDVASNFNFTLGELKSIRDRIGAESTLATQLAAAATPALGLTAANFDDFKIFVDLLESLMSKSTGQTVSVSIGTGGHVELAWQRML